MKHYIKYHHGNVEIQVEAETKQQAYDKFRAMMEALLTKEGACRQ